MARFMLVVLLAGLGARVAAGSWSEEYVYETFSRSDAERERLETVQMQVHHGTNGVVWTYKSRRARGWEMVHVTIDTNQVVEAGLRTEYNEAGRLTSMSRVWVEGNTVLSETGRPGRGRKRRSWELDGDTLAIDVSLLYALRFFPFETRGTKRYHMAALTGHFVPMTVTYGGTEEVTVPAGTFSCHRLVGHVDIIIKTIRTTTWVTVDEPHFLVKYEGKRGIFLAPTYTTELIRRDSVRDGDSAGSSERLPDETGHGVEAADDSP